MGKELAVKMMKNIEALIKNQGHTTEIIDKLVTLVGKLDDRISKLEEEVDNIPLPLTEE